MNRIHFEDYIECGIVTSAGPKVAFIAKTKAEAYIEEIKEKEGDKFSYWIQEVDLIED